MTPADTALRELLIAAGDIQGLGLAPNSDAYFDAYGRYDAAYQQLSSEGVGSARSRLPNPTTVLRSLGWMSPQDTEDVRQSARVDFEISGFDAIP